MNKLLLLAACVFCAGTVAAQNIAPAMANGDPQMRSFAFEHSQRAAQTGLAQEQDIREQNVVTYAHGERPLWEFMSLSPTEPLGDIARTLKQERAAMKKAAKSWSN
jgi:hypothetical protein